jgi:hypothetical protein
MDNLDKSRNPEKGRALGKRGRKTHPLHICASKAYHHYGISHIHFKEITENLTPAAHLSKDNVPYYRLAEVLPGIKSRLREIVVYNQSRFESAQIRYEEFLEKHPDLGLEGSGGAK